MISLAPLACCMALLAAAPPEPGSLEVWAGPDGIHTSMRGYADIESSAPVAEDTVFRFSSLTKSVTAVAVLTLVQDGRLDLTETVASLLPGTPPAWGDITVEHLLAHTSGLECDMTPVLDAMARDWTPADLVAAFDDCAPRPPGQRRFSYNNLNYWLLGRIIETRSGQSYWAYLQARLFAPLGLTHLRAGDTDVLIPGRARGYIRGADGSVRNAPPFSGSIGFSAGGLVGTARELARWHLALSQGRVLRPDLLALLSTGGHPSAGATTYGMGWYVGTLEGRIILHHGGSSPGHRSCAWWDPGRGRFAAVLSNSEDGGEPCDAARDLLLRTSEPQGRRETPP